MKNLSRSPFLWISATALSAMLYFFAFRFFPETFPIIHLDITMDLEQALEQADIIAKKNNFGPTDHRNAAMFHTDNTVKTFVELEAGGKDAVVAMMEEKLYMPYTWQVRHFKEHEKNECKIAFTPDGTPYGFIETISENDPGAQLSEKDARNIAEKVAADWNITFDNYHLVEASQKTEISTRIDHTFVYERTDKKIGEGLYRLKIVVSGDKVTELTHFVKVPEAFTRRYAQMRSANSTIAYAANIMMWLLYIVGGCGLGLYWIIRKRWYTIKQPLLWGIALACAATLTSVNQLPFLWMSYNSASSANGFLMQLLLMFFIALLAQTAFLTAVIATAESLTRRAFGHHPQLWSIWATENGASFATLGRTVGGYLFVGFLMAFGIVFYLLSIRYLGWWSPAGIPFDPNILATYAPWFSPLAISLQAGFMEECLFRAIPLAGAALLGNHFSKRNWWIGAAFIIQALIFGGAHAHYPVQPSYARVIELLIPSFIFAATYLKFGLLPTIVAHFVYDVIWFSIPIFISHSPDAFSYKIIIVIATLFPLLFVLYARFRQGRWTELPQSACNSAWQPSAASERAEEPVMMHTESTTMTSQRKKTIIAFGILGVIAWACTTRFTHDGITITINRSDATTYANDFLHHNNIVLNEQCKTLPLIFTHYKLVPHIAAQHKFIWKKGTKELYHQLLGSYLQPAHWTIRYAQFEGDIVERTEEHKVMLYSNTVWRHYHQLPESSAGAALTQQQARAIAHKTIQEQFDLDPTQLIEISATQAQLPNRINWLFIFSNAAIYPLQTGQARISIVIAGDEVVDAARTIHVPEEWERKEHNKQNILNIVMTIFSLLFMFFLLFAALLAFRQRKNFPFSRPLFIAVLCVTIIISIVDILNAWPSIIGAFNTSLPLTNQLFQFITSLGISALVKSVFYAFIISCVWSYNTGRNRSTGDALTISTGICSGLFFAGIIGCIHKLVPSNMPLWPQYDSLGCLLPLLASLLSSITHYIQTTVAFSLLFILVDTATVQWQKNRIFFTIIAILCGIAMIGLPSLKALPLWIISGTIIGIVLLALYRFVMKNDYALIPLATLSYVALELVQQGMFNAYPDALLAAIINVCAVTAIAVVWYWYTSKQKK